MKLFAVLALIICSMPTQAQAQEPRFFESLYDVPIMPNMVELPDMAVSFDKPHGRIAYAGAQTTQSLSPEGVLAFYDRALPQMGWTVLKIAQNMREYRRKEEDLRLFFVRSDGAELLQFMLFPAQNFEQNSQK